MNRMDTVDEQFQEADPPPARRLNRLRKARSSPINHNARNVQLELTETTALAPATLSSDLSHPKSHQLTDDGQSPPRIQETEGSQVPVAEEDGHQYWDEEDELEDYFEKANQQDIDCSLLHNASDRDVGHPASQGDNAITAYVKGSSEVCEGIDIDTQRILRETASRDRLGKSSFEVEVKPISTILDKIKQRQQEAFDRAAKLNIISAPSFEEIFAVAQKGRKILKSATAAATYLQGTEDYRDDHALQSEAVSTHERSSNLNAQRPDQVIGKCTSGRFSNGKIPHILAAHYHNSVDIAATDERDGPDANAALQPAHLDSDDDDNLEIVSQGSESEAEAKIVEIPSTTKKKKRSLYQSQEVEFEDEILIDDGYISNEELDKEAQEHLSGSLASEEGEVDDEDEASMRSKDVEASTSDTEKDSEINSKSAEVSEVDQGSQHPDRTTCKASGETQAGDGVNPAPKKKETKFKPMFLDMEAELSDEDVGAQHSDDDEEDDVDEQGELADLIGTAKESRADRRRREELHRQWAEQKDAKELQQVLKGLKQGFRRRGRGGFMDDEDEEEDGRRRRARMDDGDDVGMEAGPVPWFQDAIGSDEDAEDLELLKRAQQQRALEESSKEEFAQLGGIPLDENSQEVLSLLARSGSEPQVLQLPPRSRLATAGPVLGSASAGASAGPGRLSRGLSFVGRQPSVQRCHSGSLATVGSRSFVFGRDDSNSTFAADKAGAANSESQDPEGPTNFANLRQLTGAGAARSNGTSSSSNKGAKPASSGLVSRLAAVPKQGSGKHSAAFGSCGADAASAVFQQIVNRK